MFEIVPIYPMPPDPGLLDLPQFIPNHSYQGDAIYDSATVYLKMTVSGTDIYDPGCFIIGEGEAQLRWFAGDQQLRWLGYDANPRWEAVLRLGTGQC